MSQVTDVIMLVRPEDEHNIEELSFWLASDEPRSDDRTTSRIWALMPITGPLGEDLWDGYKALSFSLWGGVTNNLDWEKFFTKVEKVRWETPQKMQLLMKEDGDSYFRLYMLSDGRLYNFAPLEPDAFEPRPT